MRTFDEPIETAARLVDGVASLIEGRRTVLACSPKTWYLLVWSCPLLPRFIHPSARPWSWRMGSYWIRYPPCRRVPVCISPGFPWGSWLLGRSFSQPACGGHLLRSSPRRASGSLPRSETSFSV